MARLTTGVWCGPLRQMRRLPPGLVRPGAFDPVAPASRRAGSGLEAPASAHPDRPAPVRRAGSRPSAMVAAGHPPRHHLQGEACAPAQTLGQCNPRKQSRVTQPTSRSTSGSAWSSPRATEPNTTPSRHPAGAQRAAERAEGRPVATEVDALRHRQLQPVGGRPRPAQRPERPGPPQSSLVDLQVIRQLPKLSAHMSSLPISCVQIKTTGKEKGAASLPRPFCRQVLRD